MTTFQIVLAIVSLIFAYKMYEFINSEELQRESVGNDGENDILEPQPASFETLIQNADIAYEKKNFSEAVMLLKEALLINKNVDTLNKYAFLLQQSQNFKEAQKALLESVAIDGNNDMTHNALASIYARQGEDKLAAEHYEKALEIDNDYAVSHFNYANLLQKIENNSKAIEHYKRTLELDSSFEEAAEELERLEG